MNLGNFLLFRTKLQVKSLGPYRLFEKSERQINLPLEVVHRKYILGLLTVPLIFVDASFKLNF